MDFSPFIFIGFFVVVVILFIVLATLSAKKRQEALAAFAAKQGLSFTPEGRDQLLSDYRAFDPFGRGGSRKAYNLVAGRRGEVQWEMFDYRFSTGSGKNRRTHHYGIVAARLPLMFPQTSIRPEGFFDKVAGMLGFEDINFESEEFSRRFHVKCEDRRRAYDLIHPRMIDFLLAGPALHWQLGGPYLVLTRSERFSPADLEGKMRLMEEFIAHLPEYLRHDLRQESTR